MDYIKNINDNLERLLKLKQDCSKSCSPKENPISWIHKEEVMALFRISSSTYYKWRKDGILVPSSSIGGDKYLLEDLQDLMLSKKHRERLKPSDKSSNEKYRNTF